MSSSMRNAIQRRPHRERSQPHERRHLGLLEKHKDYSLRAKDYKKKQAYLKNLRLKAQDRNEDEFYFGMHSQKGPGSSLVRGKAFTGRIEGDRGSKGGMDMDVVRLLKTQDIAYVRTVRNVARKEAEELRRRLVLARQAGGVGMSAEAAASNKIIFMDGVEEREEALSRRTDGGGRPGTDEDEDGEEFEGFGDEMDEDASPADAGKDAERRLAVNKLVTRLENAEKKLEALDSVERHLELQQAKMAKTATSGGFTRKGTKLMVRKRKK